MAVVESCQKPSPAQPVYPATITFSYAGFAIKDTFEMVLGNKVIEVFYPNEGFRKSQLIGMATGSQQIYLRKKGAEKMLGEVILKDTPRSQTRTFYFEGSILADRPQFEEVSNNVNFGFRLALYPKFPQLLKGDIDVHIYEWKTRRRPLPVINEYIPVRVIRNVSGNMGEYFELPPFQPETGINKFYMYKIYKAGTLEPPFVPGTDLSGIGPDYEKSYGQFQFMVPGKTMYVLFDCFENEGKFTGFNPMSISSYFN